MPAKEVAELQLEAKELRQDEQREEESEEEYAADKDQLTPHRRSELLRQELAIQYEHGRWLDRRAGRVGVRQAGQVPTRTAA